MASEALDKAGLHFDDLNRIRVLDEESSSQAQELKEVCQDFLGDIGDFQVIGLTLIKQIVNKIKKITISENC